MKSEVKVLKKIRKTKNKPYTVRKLLKDFSSYYKPHAKLFILDMICAFLIAVCNLFYPFITKNVINNFIPNKQLNFMLVWLGALLAVYLVKAGLTYFVEYYGHLVGVRIQGDMRRKMFAHLQTLPFTYYDENKTGKIMSRMINDLFEISELAHHGPEDLFLSVITIIGAIILLVFVNPWLSLIVATVIPLIVIYLTIARKSLMQAWKRMREETSEINSSIESAVAGIRVSRAYTAEKHQSDTFETYNQNFQTARTKAYRVMASFHTVMTFLTDFLYFVAILAGGLFFYYGKIDVGDLTAFILYIVVLINPIRTFISIFEQIQGGMSGFIRYEEVLAIKPEEERANAIDYTVKKGDIAFENVTFGYSTNDKDKMVISDFNLTVKAGETLALVGPSGGGKTTLCHLLPRFYDVQKGDIKIDGIDIRDIKLASLRKNIGIVAQDVFLFAGSIKENILYGNFDATEEELIDASKKANIYDFVTSLPDGFDTEVGERGVKLSGGQKQRISIARAFLKNPKILILDEATSALDNITEMQIQEALEKLSVGRTTIVVAHRLSTVKNADEIAVVTQDGIIEQGNHDELMKLNGTYATLYNEQFRQ